MVVITDSGAEFLSVPQTTLRLIWPTGRFCAVRPCAGRRRRV